MTEYRERKHQRPLADDFGDAAHSLAQVELFPTEERDRLSLHATIDDCGAPYVAEAVNLERPDALFFETNESKYRKRVQSVTQVIEHVIPETIDHARLDDRVVETGVAHDLFGLPLRFVIRRTTVCSRPQETQ